MFINQRIFKSGSIRSTGCHLNLILSLQTNTTNHLKTLLKSLQQTLYKQEQKIPQAYEMKNSMRKNRIPENVE